MLPRRFYFNDLDQFFEEEGKTRTTGRKRATRETQEGFLSFPIRSFQRS